MKKFIPVFVVTLAAILFFNGKKYDELVTSRSAESIYSSGCAACHDAGIAGAPMMGNKAQWEARQAKGYEMLVNNAYNGINGMPAKGLCADCTKEEIGIAVQYMLDTI